MRTLDKLILKAVVPPFLIALTVLTFVVFLHDFGRLSELLITRSASLEVIGAISGTLLPAILIFSLPLSYLIGTLIGLSGLSGESQIIALRACGVPIRYFLRSLMGLALVAGGVTAIFTLYFLPRANDTLQALKERVSLRQATSQIQPRVFAEDIPGFVFYLDDLDLDRQRWSRVFLSDQSKPESNRIVLAREGEWVTDRDALRLQLHLRSGTVYEVDPGDPGKDKVSFFASTDIPIDLSNGSASQPAPSGAGAKPRKPPEMRTLDLWRGHPQTSVEQRVRELLELHKRVVLPVAVLAFALVGLSFGIHMKKGGRASGFVLSAVAVLVYYSLLSNGLRLASVGKISPWLGAWGANLLLLAAGVVFLARSERSRRSALQAFPFFQSMPGRRDAEVPTGKIVGSVQVLGAGLTARSMALFRLPKIVDLYVSRGFCLYFLWSVLACSGLFVILTLFDLLDDIIRNGISLSYVLDYFVFLMPQILIFVVPMSVLLATLINFGLLEKASEITALKAGGWSLYRIAIPVLIVSCGICLGLYLLQDYILPYANIRQDGIRHIIKGRPAQTSMRPQRKWIFGEDNRIFNYDYYDAGQSLFVGLNVYEVDLQSQKIHRRYRADRARINGDGTWTLHNGWVRDFRPESESFQQLDRLDVAFSEKATYFQKEVFEPKESSKMSYIELREYINYLRQTGYNARELQVELYKKISFPFSCAVMALVGIPFSFSMGRRGAFFGITVSIVVAMAYWGLFNVFEQMGVYGLLVPLLAAWAPNLLFGGAGLFLLLMIRT